MFEHSHGMLKDASFTNFIKNEVQLDNNDFISLALCSIRMSEEGPGSKYSLAIKVVSHCHPLGSYIIHVAMRVT